jgi:hypothetical protein
MAQIVEAYIARFASADKPAPELSAHVFALKSSWLELWNAVLAA